jgi:transcriptional regulator with XRE-family HTH domain
MSISKTDPKFVRAYERAILRTAFVSLFRSIIAERKRRDKSFTLQGLAKKIGTNKAEVSRWFKGEPNWTINTISTLANALNVDLEIKARDRLVQGATYTPAGIQTSSVAHSPRQEHLKTTSVAIEEGLATKVERQVGRKVEATAVFSEAA